MLELLHETAAEIEYTLAGMQFPACPINEWVNGNVMLVNYLIPPHGRRMRPGKCSEDMNNVIGRESSLGMGMVGRKQQRRHPDSMTDRHR